LSGLGFCLSSLGGGGLLPLLAFVTTINLSFGGRLSPFFCANAPAETTPSITITSNSRSSLIISPISPHAKFAHGREKELRRPGGSKKDATSILCEESTSGSVNSHGFELSRTVWYSHKKTQNAQIIGQLRAFSTFSALR
jgi:hypothetical protein